MAFAVTIACSKLFNKGENMNNDKACGSINTVSWDKDVIKSNKVQHIAVDTLEQRLINHEQTLNYTKENITRSALQHADRVKNIIAHQKQLANEIKQLKAMIKIVKKALKK